MAQPIDTIPGARKAARLARRASASQPNLSSVPRAFRGEYMAAWQKKDAEMRAEVERTGRLLRAQTMSGPRGLLLSLGPDYGGPSVSIEGGEWILYVWRDAPSDIEVLVRHSSWERFLDLCAQYGEQA